MFSSFCIQVLPRSKTKFETVVIVTFRIQSSFFLQKLKKKNEKEKKLVASETRRKKGGESDVILDAELASFFAVTVHVTSGRFTPTVGFPVHAPISGIFAFSFTMTARLGANLRQQCVTPLRLLLGKVRAIFLLIHASRSWIGCGCGNHGNDQKENDLHFDHVCSGTEMRGSTR